jgi:hypothetical protein
LPEGESLPGGIAFWKNVTVAGGPAPVRAYISSHEQGLTNSGAQETDVCL